jgi:hypothetical protein
MRKHFTRPQKMTIISGILCLVLVIDILQLWLLTATMNSHLGGDVGVPLPAALFSLLCFALNLGLLRFLYALDRAPRAAEEISTRYAHAPYPSDSRKDSGERS